MYVFSDYRPPSGRQMKQKFVQITHSSIKMHFLAPSWWNTYHKVFKNYKIIKYINSCMFILCNKWQYHCRKKHSGYLLYTLQQNCSASISRTCFCTYTSILISKVSHKPYSLHLTCLRMSHDKSVLETKGQVEQSCQILPPPPSATFRSHFVLSVSASPPALKRETFAIVCLQSWGKDGFLVVAFQMRTLFMA